MHWVIFLLLLREGVFDYFRIYRFLIKSMYELFSYSLMDHRFINCQQSWLTSYRAIGIVQGAAVTLVELGSYDRASSLLEKLTKVFDAFFLRLLDLITSNWKSSLIIVVFERQERPDDAEAFRLLGEVKYELKDYEGSAAAYRSSLSVKYGI